MPVLGSVACLLGKGSKFISSRQRARPNDRWKRRRSQAIPGQSPTSPAPSDPSQIQSFLQGKAHSAACALGQLLGELQPCCQALPRNLEAKGQMMHFNSLLSNMEEQIFQQRFKPRPSSQTPEAPISNISRVMSKLI